MLVCILKWRFNISVPLWFSPISLFVPLDINIQNMKKSMLTVETQ